MLKRFGGGNERESGDADGRGWFIELKFFDF